MRASVLIVGSALVSSAAAAVVACSSDPEHAPTIQTGPTDGAPDADLSSDAGADADVADITDADTTNPFDAAVSNVEQVVASIDGISYKFQTITLAEVGAGGLGAISANEGTDNGASIDLVFDPKIGTTACADSNAKIVFTTSAGVAQASQATGDCSMTVLKVGAVGDAFDGTFKGNLKQGDGTTLFSTGKFHVLRKK